MLLNGFEGCFGYLYEHLRPVPVSGCRQCRHSVRGVSSHIARATVCVCACEGCVCICERVRRRECVYACACIEEGVCESRSCECTCVNTILIAIK